MKLGKLRHESKYLAIRYFYTKKNWSIEWMCRQLEISRAAYYKWLHREIPYGATIATDSDRIDVHSKQS